MEPEKCQWGIALTGSRPAEAVGHQTGPEGQEPAVRMLWESGLVRGMAHGQLGPVEQVQKRPAGEAARETGTPFRG
jgi:hypothetical protein